MQLTQNSVQINDETLVYSVDHTRRRDVVLCWTIIDLLLTVGGQAY